MHSTISTTQICMHIQFPGQSNVLSLFINTYLFVFSDWGNCWKNICVFQNGKQILCTVRSWGITVRSWCDQRGQASLFTGTLILILEDVLHFRFPVWLWKNPLFKCLWALQQDLGLVPKKFGSLVSLSLPKVAIWKACFVQHELSSWLSVFHSENQALYWGDALFERIPKCCWFRVILKFCMLAKQLARVYLDSTGPSWSCMGMRKHLTIRLTRAPQGSQG